MKNNRQTKKLYTPPSMNIVEIECESAILAMSGYGYDSDDSEFGAPAKAARRGEWGNLWNE